MTVRFVSIWEVDVTTKSMQLGVALLIALCYATPDVVAGDESGRTPIPPTAQRTGLPVGVPMPELPTNAQVIAQIDAAFTGWSTTWWSDRYVKGTARVGELGIKDAAFLVRGTFDFTRGGRTLSIPYAAAFAKGTASGSTSGASPYSLVNLCYNDTTSGMTDCVTPGGIGARQAAAAQNRQMMGTIIAAGLVAVIVSDSGSNGSVGSSGGSGDRRLECIRWERRESCPPDFTDTFGNRQRSICATAPDECLEWK